MNLPMKNIRTLSIAFFAGFVALFVASHVAHAQSKTGKNGLFPTKSVVIAQKSATGVVKMRMDHMKAMGTEMKRIGAMVRGKKRFDGSKIAAASEKIADHGRKSSKLFPKGSWQNPTRALPKIWKDWRGFTRAMNSMVRSAIVLAESGRAGNKARANTAFIALGKSCGACHRNYRVKKKKSR